MQKSRMRLCAKRGKGRDGNMSRWTAKRISPKCNPSSQACGRRPWRPSAAGRTGKGEILASGVSRPWGIQNCQVFRFPRRCVKRACGARAAALPDLSIRASIPAGPPSGRFLRPRRPVRFQSWSLLKSPRLFFVPSKKAGRKTCFFAIIALFLSCHCPACRAFRPGPPYLAQVLSMRVRNKARERWPAKGSPVRGL